MDVHMSTIKHEDTECERVFDDIEMKEEELEIGSAYKSVELNDVNKQYPKVSFLFFGQKTYKCIKCNITFDFNGVSKHNCSIQGCIGESYQCNCCFNYFATTYELRYHEKVQCRTKVICMICAKCFNTEDNLSDHMSTHTRDKSYKCSYCGYLYDDNYSLEQHTRLFHRDSLCPFKCSICDKSFESQIRLDKHLWTHIKYPYSCPTCYKKIRYKHKLEEHQRSHQCKYCGKTLYRLGLESHLKYCEKNFDRKNTETKNMSLETPYRCSYCEKCFESKWTLDHHKQLHTGVQLYQCSYCNKKFSNQKNFKRHVLIHTKSSEEQFQCSACHQYFDLEIPVSPKSLEQKPNKCNHCENALARFEKNYQKGHKEINKEKSLYNSSTANKAFDLQVNTIDKQMKCEKGYVHHVDEKYKIKQEIAELQQDIRPFSNLKFSCSLDGNLDKTQMVNKNIEHLEEGPYNIMFDDVKVEETKIER